MHFMVHTIYGCGLETQGVLVDIRPLIAVAFVLKRLNLRKKD